MSNKYLLNNQETKAIAATATPTEQRSNIRKVLMAHDGSVMDAVLDLFAQETIGPIPYVRGDVVTLVMNADIEYNDGYINEILENRKGMNRAVLYKRICEVTDSMGIARKGSVLKPKLLAHGSLIEDSVG
jgi:hypothetical protein